MADYLVMTDSSADIPQEFQDRHTLGIIPMVLEIGDKEYVHDRLDGWDSKAFFKELQTQTGRTSQIVPSVYMEYFKAFFHQKYHPS